MADGKLPAGDEGLVQIEVAGIETRDFVVRFVGDTLFLPLIEINDFLLVHYDISPDMQRISILREEEESIDINRSTRMITTGDHQEEFNPRMIRVADGNIFFHYQFYLDLLNLSGNFDIGRLKLRISASEDLPIVQFRRSLSHHVALILDEEQRGTLAAEPPVGRQLLGGSMVTWTLQNSTVDERRTSTGGSLRYGAQFMYGVLELGGIFLLRDIDGTAKLEGELDSWSWQYYMPTNPVLKSVTLGTVQVPTGTAYGVSLSNAPLAPRTSFATHDLTGQTRPGWIVEMYDGNRLVDVTKADSTGRYRFSVPVGYGTTDRKIRELGPKGEIIISNRRLQLGSQMIPAGEIEYDANFGLLDLDQNAPVSGFASVGIGVWDNLTLGARAEYSSDHIENWSQDSVVPSFFTNLWLGGGSSVNSGYNVRTNRLNGAFNTITADNMLVRLSLDSINLDTRVYATSATFNIPVGAISLGARGGFSHGEEADRVEVEPIISGYVGGISFDGGVQFRRELDTHDTETTTSGLWDGTLASLRLLAAPFNKALLMFSGSYDTEEKSFPTLEATAYYRLTDELGISVGYNVPDLNWSQGRVQAQFSMDFTPVRLSVGSSYRSGSVATNSFAQGGVILSDAGIYADCNQSIGEAAIIVRPFYDRNMNGERDSGEELLEAPFARLSIGGTVLSSQDGTFRSIPAYRDVTVEVDRWAFGQDGLFPSKTQFALFTSASGLHYVDVPLAPGVDVSGKCVFPEDKKVNREQNFRPVLTGLRLYLTSSENGAVYEGEAFSDGSIFIPSVAAGTYQLKFDKQQLKSRNLCVDSQPGKVVITEQATEIPTVILGPCLEKFEDGASESTSD